MLMEGAGLRRSEVLGVSLGGPRPGPRAARVFRKGQNWHCLPLAPDVVDELRASFRELQPELDDHVFTVEVEQWVSQYERAGGRRIRSSRRANRRCGGWFARMQRAGIRELSPHQLRHGFANRFLRESGRDVAALRR